MQAWKTAIANALVPNGFSELATMQMMGVFLSVYARNQLPIGGVKTAAVSCGAGLTSATDTLKKETQSVPLLGALTSGLSYLASSARDYMPETQNKGAVAVKLDCVRGRSVVIVCSHLAAGHKGFARRNDDYHQIVRALNFGDANNAAASALEADAPIYRADFAFWIGDLNYRIEAQYEVDPATASVRR